MHRTMGTAEQEMCLPISYRAGDVFTDQLQSRRCVYRSAAEQEMCLPISCRAGDVFTDELQSGRCVYR